jgi:SAM-dependent methyltransferase
MLMRHQVRNKEQGFDMAACESAMSVNIAALREVSDRYLRWTLSLFPFMPGMRILDLGSGPGFYLESLMAYQPRSYCAADASSDFLEHIARLAKGRLDCQTIRLDLTDGRSPDMLRGNAFDAVLCFDVLEHISDDQQALAQIRTILLITGRGQLFLRVPALSCIYGQNDRAIGHYRRYSLRALKRLLRENGFMVRRAGYQNALGVLPWWVIGRVLKRNLAVSSREGKFFDALVPALQFVERSVSPPFGLSLYAVADAST